jgi:hypothetical protein
MRLKPRFTTLTLMLLVVLSAILLWLARWWNERANYLLLSRNHASMAKGYRG